MPNPDIAPRNGGRVHAILRMVAGAGFGAVAGPIIGIALVYASFLTAHALNPEIRGTGLELYGGAVLGAFSGVTFGVLFGVALPRGRRLGGSRVVFAVATYIGMFLVGFSIGTCVMVPVLEAIRFCGGAVPSELFEYTLWTQTGSALIGSAFSTLVTAYLYYPRSDGDAY